MSLAPRQSLVVGLGNTLRGDDALGPLVARRLRTEVDPSRTTVLARAALTPELACEVARADLVIFLDASVEGEIGRIVCREVAPRPSNEPATHGLAPSDLLALSGQLYGRTPPAYLLTTRGVSFELSDGLLTPAVAAMVEPLVRRTQELLAQGGCGDGS